ncbi:MAG: prolipoprotein diacylglyceryl transferase [Woeseiaceae bacterium]|nr:prolipoprotein diacylglyceryl transferase [Woeseiaceae bacterium]
MYSHFSPDSWVTPFGLIFIGAIVVAWVLARRNATSISIDASHIDLLMPLTIVTGLIGGTLVALAMPMDHMIAGEAMNHGIRIRLFGMLGTGAIALFVYSRFCGLSFRRLLDIFALPTLVGLMIHRIGCYMAGCCWGDIVSHPVNGALAAQVQTTTLLSGIVQGVQYPPGSLPYEQHLAMGLIESDALVSLPVYPVQLYEAVILLVIVLALSRLDWRRQPRGTLTVLTVCAYAIIRFGLEYLRADGAIVLGNLTITQLQCVVLLAIGILLPRLRRSVVS